MKSKRMSKDRKESGRVSEPRVTYRTRKRARNRREREVALAEIKRIRKKYGAPQKVWGAE